MVGTKLYTAPEIEQSLPHNAKVPHLTATCRAKLMRALQDGWLGGSILGGLTARTWRRVATTTQADMYSLGIIAFELLSRFTTGMERIVVLNELRAQHTFPAAFLAQHPLSSPATRLITWLLEADPAKRPSAGEVRVTTSRSCPLVMVLRVGGVGRCA